jgi:hypothetical protein
MKTTIHLVDDMYELLNISAVHNSMISGDVFAGSRPVDHRSEAVSINCLPVTGDQLQKAVVNVNIHVPNLELTINGQPDNSQPNRVRLKIISDIVLPLLKDAVINNTVTQVEGINLIEDTELHEHYLNIRVKTNSINL